MAAADLSGVAESALLVSLVKVSTKCALPRNRAPAPGQTDASPGRCSLGSTKVTAKVAAAQMPMPIQVSGRE